MFAADSPGYAIVVSKKAQAEELKGSRRVGRESGQERDKLEGANARV